MDFKRIQVLLLAFFVVFDLYLGYLLVERGSLRMISQDSTEEVNVVQEMKARGVEILNAINVNSQQPELAVVKTAPNNELRANRHQLQNQTVSISPEGILSSEFTNPIELDISLGEDSQELTREDFLWIRENILMDETLFIHGEQYLNHWYSPQENLIIIRMVTKEGYQEPASTEEPSIPISDGTAELRILLDKSYNMISYMQTYQTEAFRLEEEKELISSQNALEIIENRIDTTLPNDAEIFSLKLSYYQSVTTKDFNIYHPAWEVIYFRRESGQTQSVLVDAIRGNVVDLKGFTN